MSDDDDLSPTQYIKCLHKYTADMECSSHMVHNYGNIVSCIFNQIGGGGGWWVLGGGGGCWWRVVVVGVGDPLVVDLLNYTQPLMIIMHSIKR